MFTQNLDKASEHRIISSELFLLYRTEADTIEVVSLFQKCTCTVFYVI
jgi:hypothetical protein